MFNLKKWRMILTRQKKIFCCYWRNVSWMPVSIERGKMGEEEMNLSFIWMPKYQVIIPIWADYWEVDFPQSISVFLVSHVLYIVCIASAIPVEGIINKIKNFPFLPFYLTQDLRSKLEMYNFLGFWWTVYWIVKNKMCFPT